jgi:hypothetical protein
MVPGLVCYLSCVLEGCAIDPLLCLTFALSVEFLAKKGDLSMGATAMVLSSLALLARIIGEYHPRLGRSEVYDMQSESTHLTEQVVWSTRRREAELLTRELQQPDEPPATDQRVVWSRQPPPSTHNA